MALRLAARGAGWVSPNPMVGAVVVSQGEVVGRGWHRRYGGPHAEVEALQAAGGLARGAELYVTLEPCNHVGKTPPCTEAVLAAGVTRVVVATLDPNPQVTGGGVAYLRQHGLKVETGILEAEAKRLNEAWFKWLETGRPWVIAKAACSLDGRIATAAGQSQWLTGPQARAFGHKLRHQVDAVLVGINTVLADDPQLTTRLPRKRRHPLLTDTENREHTGNNGYTGKDPIRIILDSHLRLPLEARLLHLKSPAPTWVATTEFAPREKIRTLKNLGVDVLVLPTDKGRVALPPLLTLLGQREVQSLLVEGGAEVLGSFFDQKLVNKFFFFYAPKFLGGRQALSVLGGQGVQHLQDALSAKDLSLRFLGPDLLISGYL